MSRQTLFDFERERELEKIRGKKKRNGNGARKPPKTVRAIRLSSRATLYPLDERPDDKATPGDFPRSVKFDWIEGFALEEAGKYVGYLERPTYGTRRWAWWTPGRTGTSAFYDSIREALEDRGGIYSRTEVEPSTWTKLQRLERQILRAQGAEPITFAPAVPEAPALKWGKTARGYRSKQAFLASYTDPNTGRTGMVRQNLVLHREWLNEPYTVQLELWNEPGVVSMRYGTHAKVTDAKKEAAEIAQTLKKAP